MAALQPAGVRAVAEGVDKYVGDMRRMGGATADMGSRLSQMATIAGGMIASQVFTRLADAFMSVARGAVEFGKEAVMTAARVQELDAVLLTIGRNAGIPKSELDELVESIIDLGIRTDVAQTLLIKFSRFQLDMADATKLARLAQDAAVISMQDSSEALDGLIHGITVMNTRVLRTYGITIASVTDAQEKYAAEIGKTRDELNETEMIQAVLNAVLAQGSQIAGAYEAAMETAGKQMRSMNRYVKELMLNIGKPFLGAFTSVIKAASSWIKYFQELTAEGAIFNRMLKVLASIVSRVLVKAFNRMGDVFDFVMAHVENLWLAIEAGQGVWGQLAHVFQIFMNRTKPLHEEILPRLFELFQRYLLPVIEKVMKAFTFFAQAIAMGTGPIHAMIEALSVLVPRELIPSILKLHKIWDDFVSFVSDHKDEIVGAIKAIGIAITVYLVTTKIIKMITTLGKIIAFLTSPIGLLIGTIALLGAAWAGNWGGIRDKLTEFWEKTGRPIFESIQEWLGENIPIAIEILKTFWEDTLLPAIARVWLWVQENVFPIIQELIDWLSVAIPQAIEIARTFWEETLRPALERVWLWVKENVFPIIQELITWLSEAIPRAIEIAGAFWEETLLPAIEGVWNWVKENVFPIIEELIAWLGENIPIAIQALADFWTETLWPAIQNVWAWIKEHLFPLIGALAELIGTILGKAIEAVAGFWQNVLQPALSDLWTWVKDKVIPILSDLWTWFKDKIGPAIEGVGKIIDGITQFFRDLSDTIGAIELPDWLTPGSITPFEEGLRGISDVMSDLVKTKLPQFGKEIANLPDWGGLQADFAPSVALSQPVMPAGAQTVNNTFTLGGITTNAPQEPIIADFQMLALLAEKA